MKKKVRTFFNVLVFIMNMFVHLFESVLKVCSESFVICMHEYFQKMNFCVKFQTFQKKTKYIENIFVEIS